MNPQYGLSNQISISFKNMFWHLLLCIIIIQVCYVSYTLFLNN